MSDLSYQVRAPLKLELSGGERVVIEEWSLSGFTFPGESDILPRQGVLSIPFQGVDIRFDVALRPGPEPRVLTFENLTGRQRETLAIFYRSILSGRMASTEDIITSLDTPVDLVPMGEKEEEKAAATAGKAPRSLRVLWNGLFYAMLAFVVFGIVGSTIYDRLSGVRILQGRVVAPVTELRLGEDAFVEKVLVAPGQSVRVGDVLVQLNSPRRDRDLDAVRIAIRQAEDRIADTDGRIARLHERRAAYRADLQRKLAAEVARRQVPEFLAGRNLQAVEAALAALRAFDDLRDPMALEFDDLEAQLIALRDERDTELRQLKRDLSNVKDAYDAISIIASVNGVVREVPVVEDLYHARGTLAAVVEENTPRQVVGWISEGASQSVHVGQRVRLRVTGADGSRSLGGTVVDTQAGVDPDRPAEFGVVVTVQTDQTDLDRNRAELRPGAPVDMRADRGWALTPYVVAFRAWWS